MELRDFHFLLSPEGSERLEQLTETPITPQNHLALASQLRQEVTSGQAHALLETAMLRQRAEEKFSRAAQMFFTRPALEQASSEIVSAHRSARYAAAGFDCVADLGCSVGGDALNLAAGTHVIGVDRDRLRLRMARENVSVYGREDHFQPLLADLRELPPLGVDALFFDPGRRDERGRRLTSVHDYRPPLSLLDGWLPVVPHAGVKVSPGVDYAELPEGAEVEFISASGEVKEAVFWFGALNGGVARRATLLPSGDTLTTADDTGEQVPVTRPGDYLYEPDGAVIRAHLVEALAQRLGAAKIDEEIAYLTADRAQPTPFARCFAVDEAMPFQLKRLRHELRRRGVGRVTVKKRGSPLEPETLQRRLRLEGETHATLFLTHVQGEPYVLIGREYGGEGARTNTPENG
ncbi:MAG: class I SAM-dependent methyltransferase [Candidatus Promineifilaceae bacterium]|nr:class I SAM-dependent methyltransferase [Candidatus Promineifilaceae bacterium]